MPPLPKTTESVRYRFYPIKSNVGTTNDDKSEKSLVKMFASSRKNSCNHHTLQSKISIKPQISVTSIQNLTRNTNLTLFLTP